MIHFPTDRAFLWFLTSCSATLVAIPAVMKLAPIIGAIDDPSTDTRRIHKTRIPRIGGLALGFVFLLVIFLYHGTALFNISFITGFVILMGIGIYDDVRGLSAWVKLFGQSVSVGLLIFPDNYFHAIPLPLTSLYLTNKISCILATWFTSVGVINAFNLIDGLDGLCSGIGAIAIAGLGALALASGNVDLSLLTISCVGILSALLAFNSHPAKLFLGDTGSLLIGYIFCAFTLSLYSHCSRNYYSPFLPLFFVIVPCSDCVWVMLSRLIRDRSPFRADKTHVHHRVLRMGLPHQYAVLFLLFLSFSVTLIGLCLRHKSNDVVFLLLICLVEGIIGGIRLVIHTTGYRRIGVKFLRFSKAIRSTVKKQETHRGYLVSILLRKYRFINYFTLLSLFLIYAYSGIRPTLFLGWISISLLLLLLIAWLLLRDIRHHFLFSLIYAISCFLAMYSEIFLDSRGSRKAIAISRLLIFYLFFSSLIRMINNGTIMQTIESPIDLLLVGGCVSTIIFVNSEYGLYLPAVISSSIALFVILKSLRAVDREYRTVSSFILISLLLFIVSQLLFVGLANPFSNNASLTFFFKPILK